MEYNLPRGVDNLSNEIKLQTVINEAVVNSIEAGAKDISITFFPDENDLKSNGKTLDNEAKSFGKMIIRDDGEGFTKENIKSFEEIGSDHKIRLGCKGIGRLVFLKLFQSVLITSLSKEKKYAKQVFDLDFDHFENQSEELKEGDSYTELTFNHPRENASGFQIGDIKKKLLKEIMPFLMGLKKDNRSCNILILGAPDSEEISTKDVPEYKKRKFSVHNKHEFVLYYSIKKDSSDESIKGSIEGYYFANSRIVHSFSSKEDLGDEVIAFQKIKDCNILFLLEGKILDENINDERNSFKIEVNQPELNSLCWKEINVELRKQISNIIEGEFPNLKKRKKQIIEDIIKDNLHLTDFIKNEKDGHLLGGAGDPKTIKKNAETKFQAAEQKFKQDSPKLPPDKKIQKASYFAAKCLIKYIQMRDGIISSLEAVNDNKGSLEAKVHNLLMKMRTSQKKDEPIDLQNNNLWLIDDRFMSYSYVASDLAIQTILKDQSEVYKHIKKLDRPDVVAFYADNSKKKLVLFEIKKPAAKNFDVMMAHCQLITYSLQFKEEMPEIKEIYLYIVSKITDKVEKVAKENNYKKVFSSRGKMLVSATSESNFTIIAVEPEAIISDARARNKTFIDIIYKAEQAKLSVMAS